jgi:hypothetical protein
VREIVTALETISDTAPLLLIFEDLQWVDQATVDLLSALARRRVPARLIVVGTTRPVDPVPQENSLLALQRDLQIHGLCHGVELESLDHSDVAELLAAGASRETLPSGFSDLIHRHSGGNPLFMVAALDHLTRRGLISCTDGHWQLRGRLDEVDLEVPDSLRQMIEAQIERLSAEEQRALEAASVVGTVFAARVAAAAVSLDPDQLGELYHSLTRRRQMLRAAGAQHFPDGSVSPRYEFMHALYRETLYKRQTTTRLATRHRRIGEQIEVLYARKLTDVGSELAYHFEQICDWPRTVKYLRLAAETAERRYAYPAVVAILERALVLASYLPEEERGPDEVAVLGKLAPIYLLSMDARALETYELLAKRAEHFRRIDEEVSALIEMGFLLSWDNSQRCVEVLKRATARSALQPDPCERAKSRLRSSFVRIWADAWSDNEASVCREALSEIRQTGEPIVLAPYLIDYSWVLLMCSEYRESRQIALEGLAVLTGGKKENPCATLAQTNGATAAYLDELFLGEWGEALREIESTLVTLTKNGNEVWAHALRFWRAYLNIQAMDFSGARMICEAAVQALGDAITAPDRRWYLAVAGTAEVALGNYEGGLRHLSAARREMDQRKVMNDWYTRLLVESALTELWLSKDDIAQARVQADQFLRVTLATRERTFRALAWQANARVAVADADQARAQVCVAHALSAMEGFEVPLAEWRVHATASTFEEMRGDLTAAAQHRELSRAAILKIAQSLGPAEPLRAIFLSAPPVVHILGSPVAG